MSSKGVGGGDRVTDHVNTKQRLLTEVSVSDDKENTSGNSGKSSGTIICYPAQVGANQWKKKGGRGNIFFFSSVKCFCTDCQALLF